MRKIIISCEHATKNIPHEYQKLFAKNKEILNSHRGIDIGTLEVYKKIKKYADFYQEAKVSRLIVDLNRSIKHPNLFSEFTKSLTKTQKTEILMTYYYPYRHNIENAIKSFKRKNHQVFHLSVHSFTPELNNSIRRCDVGILYDPQSMAEKELALQWKKLLLKMDPTLTVRFNYPYLGKADGLASYLRKRYPNYVGIELEMNQKFFLNDKNRMIRNIEKSFQKLS